MRPRIRNTISLMTLSILGIIGFQAYWLVHTYQADKQQLEDQMKNALSIAIGREMSARPQSELVPGVNQASVAFSPEIISLISLDSVLSGVLLEEGISVPYALGLYETDSPQADQLLATLSHGSDLTGFYVERPVVLQAGGSPQTVRLFLSHEARYLLGQMLFPLLMSALLMLLVAGCMAYMLRIIFRQKRISEVKNDFINNMTHELKTPITNISAVLEAMLDFDIISDEQKSRRYLKTAGNELSRLSDIVEKVLHIAAFEREEVILKPERFDVSQMIKGAVSRFSINQQAEIQYKNELESSLIKADPLHFEHLLNNLIDNAVKYGGTPPVVQILTREDESNVLLSISDNGAGIAPIHKDQIFDKFFRIPNEQLYRVKGFGLGLSYVKKIIDLHGGQIDIESSSGHGSTFLLSIPKHL